MPEIKEGYKLDIYVCKNLIEVYINDGEYVLSSTVYGLSDKIITAKTMSCLPSVNNVCRK